MAKDPDDFADFKNPDTLIGLGVSVEGDLETEGDIQINGKFKGTIKTEGDVILGEQSEVEAKIQADNVYIGGTTSGDIKAFNKIEIYDTGRVEGDVEAQSLSIDPGGILKGESKMIDKEEKKPEASPTFEVEEESE